jgi:hypothetical protein
MTDAAARALAANTNTDPYAADRKAARREAARSPLNGQYVTTAKSPRPGVRFTARVTRFGVEVTPEGEATSFELMSAFRHDLAEGYIRPCLNREAARERLTARPGTERHAVFVKRTDGNLRRMRFRYDPERSAPFTGAEAKGLLPVWDLDKDAARFVNLDGLVEDR